MTIAISQRVVTNRAPLTSVEFEAPAYALRERPQPSRLPKDDLGRDIAYLLAENADIASRFVDVDLDTLTVESKVLLLKQIKDLLGIRPTRRRHLGYVGP